MTLTGIKTVQREVEELAAMLPKQPTPEDEETRCWLAALTPEEIARGAEILIRASNDEPPSDEDLAFIREIASRPPVDLPPIKPYQPVCIVCGQQPAFEWCDPPAQPFCEECWKAALGRWGEVYGL